MTLFSSLYDKVLVWAAHRHACWYLAALSFSEASFFPIPPDIMLAPMSLAKREQAWFYAGLTTLASACGGVAGYFIGLLAFDFIAPLIHSAGYWPAYLQIRAWFDQWGFWAVFIAGFTPIPYKVFTITSGAVSMVFILFVVASIIGRGSRFFLVAALIYYGGENMDRFLRRYIDRAGWVLLLIVIGIYFLVR